MSVIGRATVIGLGWAAGQAVAQSPAPAPVAEVIIVTGSRIARHDADSTSPMLTLTREDIAAAAPTSVGELLQSLPGAGPSLNSNGTQGTAFGASAINLRYLGSAEGSGNRTLVLVDGHRWVNAAGGRGFRDFVDLNTIPLGIVDRIEVLKDGASAIYGADAIAGVVNIHTKRRLEGFETDLRIGQSARGDGAAASGYVNWGKHTERGALFVSASFKDSEPILTADRDLTRSAMLPLASAPPSPRGLYVLPGLSYNAYFGTPAGFAQNGANAITRNEEAGAIGTGAAADNAFHVARLPGDAFNTQVQGLYAVGPSRQGALFVRASLRIAESTNAKLEALHSRRTSSQLFAPVPLDLRGSNGFTIAHDQAYNPFGSANGVPQDQSLAFSGPALRIQRVPTALGNRRNAQRVDASRFKLALDGQSGADDGWRWDASLIHARNRASFDAANQVNFDNVYRALASPATCAGAVGCTPLDLFGTITPAMADYIRYNAHDENGTSLFDATFNATRPLMALAGGPLGLAVGYEYREETAFDVPDAFAAGRSAVLPLVQGVPQAPTSAQSRDLTRGRYHLHEAYAELSAPLVAGRPGVHALLAEGALRYSHYSTVGGKATGKAGVVYKPIAALLVRATYSQGFRAPSILELYQGQRQTSFQAVDPCNGGSGGLAGCAGVPASYHQNQFNSGLVAGVTMGNRELKPDSATNYSAGIGINAGAFSLTVDKFAIQIRDAIAARSATQLLQSCAYTGAFCSLVQRAPSGEVQKLTQAVVNLSRIEVEGVDATLRYGFPVTGARFDSALDIAYLQKYRSLVPGPDGSIAVDDRAGKSDQPRASYPRVKANATVRYLAPALSAGWNARYIGASDDVPGNAVNGGRLAAMCYHDLHVAYWLKGKSVRLQAGIDNVLDAQPPASAANNPINVDIYTYDLRGRYFYVKLSSRF